MALTISTTQSPTADLGNLLHMYPGRLHEQRLDRVADVLKSCGVRRIVDLGCGSGKLTKRLMEERQFTELLGVEVSTLALEQAVHRPRYDRLPARQKARIRLIQVPLTYRDRRTEGFGEVDAALGHPCQMAVFEHAP